MIKCEISVSKDIDKYWKNCTIKDLAEATISRLAGYYISYSAEEYLKDTITKVIQPKELFKLMNIKDTDEAVKIFQIALSFLVYIKEGEAIETSHAVFIKIADNMIKVNSKLDSKYTIDSLSKKRILKFLFC